MMSPDRRLFVNVLSGALLLLWVCLIAILAIGLVGAA